MNNTISIIIPVYNNEDTINRCLCSIQNQDWADKEIVIVDDGSTDNSYNLCKAFSESHPNTVLLSQNHSGQSAGRNLGLQYSKGSYICFCDADDELLPSALKYMMDSFKSTVDLVVGNVLKDNSPTIRNNVRKNKRESLKMFYGHGEDRLLGSVYGKLFRSSLITPANNAPLRFDETISIGEDALFLIGYILRCRTIYLNKENVYLHKKNSNGIIASSRLSDYLTALKASNNMVQMTFEDQAISELAVKDLFWVFIKVLKRLSCISDGELVKKAFESILESLNINLKIVGLPFLEVKKNKLSSNAMTYLFDGCKDGKEFIVDAADCGIAIMPAFANMHIHFEDYCEDNHIDYSSTDEFLSHKIIDKDINNNIKRNLEACEREGVLLAAYTHKTSINHSIIHVLQQAKTIDDISNKNGWMLGNIVSYSPKQIVALFSLSKKNKRPVFFHLSSTRLNDMREREKYEGSFISFLSKRGLLSEYCFIIHGCYLNETELRLISGSNASVIVCPLAEYYGNENILNVSKLSELNILWMLGTDSQALAKSTSLLQNALFLQKKQSDITFDEILFHISYLPIETSLKWEVPLTQKYVLVDVGGANPYFIRAIDIIQGRYKPICEVMLKNNNHV